MTPAELSLRSVIHENLLKISSQNNRKALRRCRPPRFSPHTVTSTRGNTRLLGAFGLWTWSVIFRRSKVKASSESKSSEKFNHLFFVPLLTFPENPTKIPLELYQLFCWHSHKRTPAVPKPHPSAEGTARCYKITLKAALSGGKIQQYIKENKNRPQISKTSTNTCKKTNHRQYNTQN